MKVSDNCAACGTCIAVCPFTAITIGRVKAEIDMKKCTKCLICVKACPVGAISSD